MPMSTGQKTISSSAPEVKLGTFLDRVATSAVNILELWTARLEGEHEELGRWAGPEISFK